ncbi:MAG: AlbA family DNA-binding domain-containing protein [Methylocella sp.]
MSTPTLFTKPFDGLDADDVRGLLGWPESGQVEFKKDIPERNGKRDPWHESKGFLDFGRDKLFKEIVAFANTLGGHLVLGIDETKSKPPTAKEIYQIPRCHELAERLSRSAQAIDPPIRGLLIRGIELNNDGSGVVVFRVPASTAAPHRALDLQAYVRRNTESTPMSMREIQDVTLATSSRGERTEARFQEASEKFRVFFGRLQNKVPAVGYRITALPATPLSLPRLFGRRALILERAEYTVQVGQQPWKATGGSIIQTRALLRGAEHYFATDDKGMTCRIYQDGSVEFEHATATCAKIYIGWIIANLIRVAKTADNLRFLGGLPDHEYSVEIELSRNGLSQGALAIQDWNASFGDGYWELAGRLTLPRLIFGPFSEIGVFLTEAHTDIFDACGANRHDPIQIKLVDDDLAGLSRQQ